MLCSGDELSPEALANAKTVTSGESYLIVEGYFLKFMLISIYSIIGLGMVTTLLLALFCSQKRSQEEIDARKGGLFKTEMPAGYESAIQAKQARTALGMLAQEILDE